LTRQANLTTRTSRLKLKPLVRHRAKIGADLFLDYRRPKSGPGTWSMKRYVDGKYLLETLDAVADDMDEADDARILSLRQAEARARDLAKSHVEHAKLKAAGPPLTVARAIEEYADGREARWLPLAGSKHDARRRLARHVDEGLAKTPLALLTTDRLQAWRKGAGERTSHDFTASLNTAAKRYRDRLPPTLRDIIKDGLASPGTAPKAAREIVALSEADVKRLVAAAMEIDKEGGWDGSLFRMALVLASTGSRFSQIARCRVVDVQAQERRILIPVSRKGRSSGKVSHTAVPVNDDVIDALKPAIAGRLGHEPLFMRPSWEPIGVGKLARSADLRPWRAPGEFGRAWRQIAERAGLPAAVPYDMRHAAIVRALSLGLPVQLVARLFDTSATMIQKNYSSSITDALSELSERMAVPLAPEALSRLRVTS
jgi:integrase